MFGGSVLERLSSLILKLYFEEYEIDHFLEINSNPNS